MTARGTLPSPLPMDQRRRARELWEAGESYGSIEATLGINKSSLKSWRARDKWIRKTEPSNELVITPKPIAADVPDSLQEAAEEYERNLRRASVIVSRRIAQMEPDAIVSRADRIKQIDSTARKALRIETEKPVCAIQIGILCQPVRPSKKDDGRLRSTQYPTRLIEAESE